MSSGKATIRSTAKHARRAVNLRRALKKWIVSDKTGNNLTKFFMMYDNVSYVPSFIRHKRREHDKIIGIDYFVGVRSTNPYTYKRSGIFELHTKNNHQVFKNYLDSLGITWFLSNLNVICVDLNEQVIEPKAVRVRTPKPSENISVVKHTTPVNKSEKITRLIDSIEFWTKKKEELLRDLDGANHEIEKASKDLEQLVKPYLGW